MATFDVIVVGVGAMGAQACWQLARRGKRVLGLDRYDIPNQMGSSHGEHRIIRLAYFEHPLYVPILRRAYTLWRELEKAGGEQVLYVTGSLDIGAAGSRIVEGSLASCLEHGLPHETLDAKAIMSRYPGIELPNDFVAISQPDGGFIAAERAVLAAARLALAYGAVLRAHEPVVSIDPVPGGGVRVTSTRGSYEAGSVIVSAGAWVGELLPTLRQLAVPERQVIGWFRPRKPDLYSLGAFPVSNLKCDLGHFYQFPMWHIPGVKIGRYHHLGETGAPDTLSRDVTGRDEEVLRAGLARYFPEANGDLIGLKTCLFTNTPDEHFILDRMLGFEDVIVASPCSGHGFKFSTAIGEILANMSEGLDTSFDLEPFAKTRFTLPESNAH